MRRCLLVLDMDLLALDEQLDLEPINYLMTRQEQEPCEVVVLSLAGSRLADSLAQVRGRVSDSVNSAQDASVIG